MKINFQTSHFAVFATEAVAILLRKTDPKFTRKEAFADAKVMVIDMIISTRGRYALRVMIDLAENGKGEYIAMKKIAERQGISLKYLERILPVLTQNNIVEGMQGKGGGYRLTRKPEEYKVGEILRLTEGDLAPVACLECGAAPCEKSAECRTLPMWKKLYDMIGDYLDSVYLSDLMKTDCTK